MKFSFTTEQLFKIVGPTGTSGSSSCDVTGIAPLELAQEGDLSFLGNPRYRHLVAECNASVVLVPENYDEPPKGNQLFLKVPDPSFALARICDYLEKQLWPAPEPGIHPSAAVAKSATIGENVYIGPLAVVEEGATIGEGTVIQGQAYIGRHVQVGKGCRILSSTVVQDYSILGDRVRLQSGAIIGAEGFGYSTIKGEHLRVPQIGRVVLEDDVDIGSNTTIDRARFKETRIGQGTKIDNLVQIGHNVSIGKHCLIVAQSGISGSTHIGDHVVIGGQVGIVGHITVGDGVQIGGQSGVTKSVPAGKIIRGMPASDYNENTKQMVLIRRLPEMVKRISEIEDLVKSLVNSDQQKTSCK